jgi:hypothetical protein
MIHMKKRIIIIFTCISSVALYTGCNSLLDVEPVSSITSSNYWKSEGDVTGYLTGTYDSYRETINSTYYMEDRGDAFEAGLEAGLSTPWTQNLTEGGAPNWNEPYKVVHNCNLILKYGKDVTFSTEANKNRAIAETHFLRASTYFFLIRIWGKVPIILEPTENDNVPMPARAPLADVMSLILSDLDAALSLFPEEGFKSKGRASKPATYALKADVLLWKAKVLGGGNADLEGALDAANKASVGTSLEETFGRIHSTDNRKGKEVIFAIHYHRDEKAGQYGSQLKPRDIFVQDAVNKNSIPFSRKNSRSSYSPSVKLENTFLKNAGDVRLNESIIKAIAPDGSVTGKFDNKMKGTNYANDDRYFDNDIVVYRHAEMILFKAEALAALNRMGEAVVELNKVRARAGIGDYTGAQDKISVEKEILEERFREFYLELKRWPDLFRFHAGGSIDVYQEVPNLVGKQTPLYFPIPRPQIDLNPNLEQTEGY